MRASLVAALLLLLGCGDDASPEPDASTPDAGPLPPEELGRCADFEPLRRPHFGDTHVHTALSLDAVLQGTRLRPADAYRFARGEEVGLQPHDAEGRPLRTARLDRPLDFLVVSDHAEFLGDVRICEDPSEEGHGERECVTFRDAPATAFVQFNLRLTMGQDDPRRARLCGDDGERCVAASRAPWREIREAAEAAYDRSPACEMVTFVGYEWSASPFTKNLHRNVIFRNERVPAVPTSYFDESWPEGLWDALDRDCVEAIAGCEALTIPHNSNLSSGLMFAPETRGGAPFDAAYAARRARMEPLIEIHQHKGDSECLPGLGVEDELCSFEKLPFDNLAGSNLGGGRPPPPTDFVRAALGQGLRYRATLGENPFEYGIVASTDTHVAAAGLVDERDAVGHGGAGPAARDAVPVGLTDYVGFNPGGLAVLWAEERSREALWAAMRRREAYGTSGPRIVLRAFGGWSYPDDLCDSPDLPARGYDGGVPMGGVLPERRGDAAPVLVVSALRDPGGERPSVALSHLQVIKGWLEGDEPRFAVIDVAGDPTDGATLDTTTCAPAAGGADALCAVWRDPEFEPLAPAFYYARAVEVATCRWHRLQCNAAGVDCSDPAEVPEAWAGCCDDAWPSSVRERAWSSPIWYVPP